MKKTKKTCSVENNVLEDALYKKALGYDSVETIEEYAIDENNNEKLIKKKISKKYVPPDISAAKTLLEYFCDKDDYSNMTDEELEAERIELINYLVEHSAIENVNQNLCQGVLDENNSSDK